MILKLKDEYDNGLINAKNEFKLLRPFNCWDTNYHLIDTKRGIEYLIDIHDVTDSEIKDEDDYYMLEWNELRELSDIDHIIEFAWNEL